MLKYIHEPDLVYYSPGDLYIGISMFDLCFQISENVELQIYRNRLIIDIETKNCVFEGNYECLYNTDK